VQAKPMTDLGQDRHAKLPAAHADHEVDRLGSGQFRRADEVSLVFAILGINDDDDPAFADGFNGIFDLGKRAAHGNFTKSVNAACRARPGGGTLL
jgi:hypothetical protein